LAAFSNVVEGSVFYYRLHPKSVIFFLGIYIRSNKKSE